MEEFLTKKFHPNDLAFEVIPGWIKRPHVDVWGDYLLKIIANAHAKRGKTNLIVNAPPRHAKTFFFGYAAAAWFLERYPDKQIIFGTHTVTHSTKYTTRVRNLIESNQHFFSVKVDPNNRQKKDWMTTQGGGMRAAGVGTAIQGDKSHLTVLDDLYPDRKSANSIIYARTLEDWLSDTVRTRREPYGVTVLCTTRWGAGDIVAHLKRIAESSKQADQYYTVNFPALCLKKNGDRIGRKHGEALWPERYDKKALNTIRKSVSPQTWHALYQGKPKSDYGQMIKKSYFRYFREEVRERQSVFHYTLDDGTHRTILKKLCHFFQFADSALLPDDSADFTCVITVGVAPNNNMFVYDVVRAHKASDEIFMYLNRQREKHYPFIKRQFIEAKQSGITALQTGVKHGLPLFPLYAEGSKECRAMPLQEQYMSGAIWHRSDSDWLDEFEKELTGFPNLPHDDQLDAIAYAALAIQSDLMHTQNSKHDHYGVARGQTSFTKEVYSAQPVVKHERTPFGIKSSNTTGYEDLFFRKK